MSNVLIIDTSSDSVAITVGTSTDKSVSEVITQRSSHSENIFLAIEKCMSKFGLKPNEIDVIGLGVGPGLFTGLRVGITAAHSMAHAIGCSLVGFSSLELAAISSVDNMDSEILIAKDARRNELYYAQYKKASAVFETKVDGISIATTLERVNVESLISPSNFVHEANNTDAQIVLDGIDVYEKFKDLTKRVRELRINPESMIDVVLKAKEQNIFLNTFTPQALYLRKSDAELSWNKQ